MLTYILYIAHTLCPQNKVIGFHFTAQGKVPLVWIMLGKRPTVKNDEDINFCISGQCCRMLKITIYFQM